MPTFVIFVANWLLIALKYDVPHPIILLLETNHSLQLKRNKDSFDV